MQRVLGVQQSGKVMNINTYLLAFISLDISSALACGLSSSFHFVKATERHLALFFCYFFFLWDTKKALFQTP